MIKRSITKKSMLFVLTFLIALVLIACKKPDVETPELTVTFVSNGGTLVAAIENVEPNTLVDEPADPTKADHVFNGWYVNQDLSGSRFDFETVLITDDLILYASWTEVPVQRHVVTFNTNGGNLIDPVIVVSGAKLTAPTNPELSGHVFEGWYEAADFSGEKYNFETAVTKNVVLNAHWVEEPAVEYTVTFNSNGGSAVEAVKVVEGGKIVKPANPTKAGSLLGAWYTDEDLTAEFNFETAISDDLTLYAKWLDSVVVKFDVDGGSEVADAEIVKGSKLTKPANPTKEDHIFVGWFIDEDLEYLYNFADTEVTANMTIYAMWTEEVTVKFQTNGGSNVADVKVGKGLVVAEPAAPVRQGFLLEGWYTEAGLVNKFDFAEDTVEASMTLHANWLKDPRFDFFMVTFNPNGGNFGLDEDEEPILTHEIEVVEGGNLRAPSVARDGWTLVGWFNGEVVFDFAEDTVDSNLTLQARWLENFTVTLNANGGDFGLDESEEPISTHEIEVPDTKAITDVASIVPPTRDNHAFSAWYSDAALTIPFDLETEITADITLYAAWLEDFTISFNSNGGSAVDSIVVTEGNPVLRPADPTRPGYIFVGWYSNEGLTSLVDFDAAVSADMTLYAKWEEVTAETNYVVFDPRISNVTIVTITGNEVAAADVPANPTRAGYRFGGWFSTKRGLRWEDHLPGYNEKIEFPYNIEGNSTTLYAYWEPVNSLTQNYSQAQTYTSSLTRDTRVILNPLEYEFNHEDAMIANMATDLYSTEVDWDTAIAKGVADFPGDFSKIENKEYSIEALDYHYILVGATRYPINKDGLELLDENGNYDRQKATTYQSTEWTYHIRDDLKFQDGTPITAATYEYTLKQYLDKAQNVFRANSYYKTDKNPNGYAVDMAYEYFTQTKKVLDANNNPIKGADGYVIYEPATVTWEDVGFEVIDDHTFKVTTWEPISQSSAVGFGNLRLVHPEKYNASLTNGQNSTYGTPVSPYMSYGPYVLKTWDEGQKLVFNKNYDYVLKGTINYKSLVYTVVDNVDQRMQLFANGQLSAAGLLQDYYAQYAEAPNVFKDWTGYPQYMAINLAESKITGNNKHVQNPILFDARFRQALLYGFDRTDYANTAYAPNVPSLLPVPTNVKVYIQDPLFYSESPQHMLLLQELGIDPESNGYVPKKAVELFDAAYANYLDTKADTDPDVITLRFINGQSSVERRLSTFIKNAYEELFNKENEPVRLVIDVHEGDNSFLSQQRSNWNFDLSLGSIGFGSSNGIHWQYPMIAFLGAEIGGAGFGLSQPYDKSQKDDLALYTKEVVKVDLKTTYNYLVELGIDQLEADELSGHIRLLNWLEEERDENDVVTKEAGILELDVFTLGIFLATDDTPWDATAAEPFPGARNDVYNLVAALEEVFFNHAPLIPTTTSSAATIYAANVKVTWPDYSSAFGWGAARYRYLTTDPDFQ